MGFGNPPVPWRTIEQTLSDQPRTGQPRTDQKSPDDPRRPEGADGGDSPAWSRKRDTYEAPALIRRPSQQRYAELHCHTSFSFLDGASSPEELVE